jgi:hypothetical protein
MYRIRTGTSSPITNPLFQNLKKISPNYLTTRKRLGIMVRVQVKGL